MEENNKIPHKPDKKSKKKIKKSDLKKIQHEEPEQTTNNDLEENNQLKEDGLGKKKLTEEEENALREIKYEKVRKCYLEMGLCCFMLLLAGIFIYLFEFTDVIRERPEKVIYSADMVIEIPPVYETIFV